MLSAARTEPLIGVRAQASSVGLNRVVAVDEPSSRLDTRLLEPPDQLADLPSHGEPLLVRVRGATVDPAVLVECLEVRAKSSAAQHQVAPAEPDITLVIEVHTATLAGGPRRSAGAFGGPPDFQRHQGRGCVTAAGAASGEPVREGLG